MKLAAQHIIFFLFGGAALTGAVIFFQFHLSPISLATNFSFPDITMLIATLTGDRRLVNLAIAGGLLGAFLSLTAGRSSFAARGFSITLALTNPLLIMIALKGAQPIYFVTGLFLVLTGVVDLARQRNDTASVALAMKLAGAMALSSYIILTFPVLFFVALFLSPWGLAPRRASGFALVIWAPSVMALLALGYVGWLTSQNFISTLGQLPAAISAMDPLLIILALFAAVTLAIAARADRSEPTLVASWVFGAAMTAPLF